VVSLRLLCAALTAALAMSAACGTSQAAPRPAPHATGDPVFAGLIAKSTDLGPAPAGEPLSIILQLKDDTAAAREAAIKSIYQPGSPNYGHFMDPAELAARYGPDAAAVARAQAWLQDRGLQAPWTKGEDFLGVSGPPAELAAVFAVDPHSYRSVSGTDFVASATDPVIPGPLKSLVVDVSHLNTYIAYQTAAAPAGGFKPQEARLAYGIKELQDQGFDGSGETVSIWALGDGFNQGDLDTWASKMGLPPLKPVLKSGPPNAKVQGEVMMDIEVVHAIAPNAQIFVYTDPLSSALRPSSDGTFAFFDRMIADNPKGIWSFSWGGCDLYGSAADRQAEANVYQKAAAAGISVLVSTGDSGAYRCMDADWGAPPTDKNIGVELPASLPLGVTAVGGTRLSVRQDGTYYNEVVWSEPLVTQGTGGGVSHWFPQPDWQKGPNVSSNQFNPNKRRMVPDVAADADPMTGLTIYMDGGFSQGGGTSQAAPLWAGLTAVLNNYLKKKGQKSLGFMNPALYDIAAGKPPYPAFNDVTKGTNLAYPATPGYDLSTGLGSPNGYNLARDLEAYQKNGGHI